MEWLKTNPHLKKIVLEGNSNFTELETKLLQGNVDFTNLAASLSSSGENLKECEESCKSYFYTIPYG